VLHGVHVSLSRFISILTTQFVIHTLFSLCQLTLAVATCLPPLATVASPSHNSYFPTPAYRSLLWDVGCVELEELTQLPPVLAVVGALAVPEADVLPALRGVVAAMPRLELSEDQTRVRLRAAFVDPMDAYVVAAATEIEYLFGPRFQRHPVVVKLLANAAKEKDERISLYAAFFTFARTYMYICV
jgi:hypothetical protein